MKILTKHLSREFLRPFLFSLGLLSLILLVSELFEKLDVFLSSKAGIAAISKYLAAYLPVSFFEIIPIATLIAVLFSASSFVQKGEYTAVKSAGINPYKLFLPVFILGFAVSVVVAVANDLILPKAIANSKRVYFEDIRRVKDYKQYTWDNLTISGNENRIFYIKHLNANTSAMDRVVINFYDSQDNITRQIDAEKMLWDEASGKWLLNNGVDRYFNIDGSGVSEERVFAAETFDFSERLKDFIFREKDSDEMRYRELRRAIKKLRRTGFPNRKEQVALQMKIAYPMANLVIIFIGLPIALAVKKSGRMLNFAFALGISFLYWGLISVGRSLGESGAVSTFLGAWLANILFAITGLILFIKSRK